MNILSFDTTLNHCSVAVLSDARIVAHQSRVLQRGHAEALMPMIGEVLEEAQLGFADLDLVAVTTGPGTFTGQRVGLSAARGIGVARDLPVQGVGSLSAIAHEARNEHEGVDILVVLDARRGQFYIQHFPADMAIWPDASPPRAIETDQLSELLPDRPCIIVGTGVELARNILGSDIQNLLISSSPQEADAAAVAELAAGIAMAQGMPLAPPAPLYLRAPDAKLPGGKSLEEGK